MELVSPLHARHEWNLLADKRGSPLRSKRVGTEGPKISVSRIPLRCPLLANERARFTFRTSFSISFLVRRFVAWLCTCDSRLSNTTFGGGHGNHLSHIFNAPLFGQTTLKARDLRRGRGARETLVDLVVRNLLLNSWMGVELLKDSHDIMLAM